MLEHYNELPSYFQKIIEIHNAQNDITQTLQRYQWNTVCKRREDVDTIFTDPDNPTYYYVLEKGKDIIVSPEKKDVYYYDRYAMAALLYCHERARDILQTREHFLFRVSVSCPNPCEVEISFLARNPEHKKCLQSVLQEIGLLEKQRYTIPSELEYEMSQKDIIEYFQGHPQNVKTYQKANGAIHGIFSVPDTKFQICIRYNEDDRPRMYELCLCVDECPYFDHYDFPEGTMCPCIRSITEAMTTYEKFCEQLQAEEIEKRETEEFLERYH